MLEDINWHGYISEMDTEFFIKNKEEFKSENFNYRLKIFFCNEIDKNVKNIKNVEIDGQKITILKNLIVIKKDIYIPNKNFKTILDIPIKLPRSNNSKKVLITLESGEVLERILNINNNLTKKRTFKTSWFNNILNVRNNKSFYVEKTIKNGSKIQKEVFKTKDNDILIHTDENTVELCIYDDNEEKIFILNPREFQSEEVLFEWTTGSMWKDLIALCEKSKKMKIVISSDRLNDKEELEHILRKNNIDYLIEEKEK